MKSKTKKVVENISDDSCDSNNSDTKFEIVVDSCKADKKPNKPTKLIKSENKVTTNTVKEIPVGGNEFKKITKKS